MAFRIFIDAGILLDFTLKAGDYKVSRELIELVVGGRIQAFVTPSVIQFINCRLKRAYGDATAKQLILTLLADVQVIDSNHGIMVNAIHSQMNDMEHALPYYTALHHKLDYYITRDQALQQAAIAVLPVCSPEEFLKNNS